MNFLVPLVVGAITGWLTGKALETEGRTRVVTEAHGFDIILGMLGAMIGDYLFFWIVIGKGNPFSEIATSILGAIALVGASQLISRHRIA